MQEDLTVVPEVSIEGELADNQDEDDENEELAAFMQDLYLDRFEQML